MIRLLVINRKMIWHLPSVGRDANRIRDDCDDVTPLTPNDPYSGRTAPLTSKRFILYIYPTNIDTEYFKHGI